MKNTDYEEESKQFFKTLFTKFNQRIPQSKLMIEEGLSIEQINIFLKDIYIKPLTQREYSNLLKSCSIAKPPSSHS